MAVKRDNTANDNQTKWMNVSDRIVWDTAHINKRAHLRSEFCDCQNTFLYSTRFICRKMQICSVYRIQFSNGAANLLPQVLTLFFDFSFGVCLPSLVVRFNQKYVPYLWYVSRNCDSIKLFVNLWHSFYAEYTNTKL